MNKGREDKALKKAVKDLPVFSPDEDLWEQIEAGLDEATVEKTKGKTYLRWVAVLLLPLIAGGLFWALSGQSNQLQYSEELLPDWPLAQFVSQDDDFGVFLEEECQPGRDICEAPEFQSLLTELQELSDEHSTILSVIEESGMDEYLVKARTRLEKEEVRLKRKIVELLKG